jgi:hypothetical protein
MTSATTALLTFRSVWYQIPVSGTGAATDWPRLTPGTNYWVVLAPSTTLTFSAAFPYNGPQWGGIDISTTAIPGDVRTDNTGGNLFTARRLNSQRAVGDVTFGAGAQASVSFLGGARNWTAARYPGTEQYRNYAAEGSNIRYGLQVFGIPQNPTNTASRTREAGDGLGRAVRSAGLLVV